LRLLTDISTIPSTMKFTQAIEAFIAT